MTESGVMDDVGSVIIDIILSVIHYIIDDIRRTCVSVIMIEFGSKYTCWREMRFVVRGFRTQFWRDHAPARNIKEKYGLIMDKTKPKLLILDKCDR